MRSTNASRRMKELREDAMEWDAEAGSLERMGGLAPAARTRREEADRLRGQAEDLRPEWRLENLAVYQVTKEKTTTKGEARTYHYWHASWREDGRVVAVYLGSAKRMSEDEATTKARRMKAGALGL